MLAELKLRHFRCFDALEGRFAPGANVICGPNAQGKTSLLEAMCVLLRLQSPRVSSLAAAIRHDRKGFLLDGRFDGRHMQFYLGEKRRKLALDSVEQRSASEYLKIGRVVFFSNRDVEIVRGPAEVRRKFLDFAALQFDPAYRTHLRSYERALRSRNLLLKEPRPNRRQIAAFDVPLVTAGEYISAARRRLIEALQPGAKEAHHEISHSAETLLLAYHSGCGVDFQRALEAAFAEDLRLRQTTAGPHRDDLGLRLNARSPESASEGQQRTVAVALKLAVCALLAEHAGRPPLLLIDDVFGELDFQRRNSLLEKLPAGSQKFITATDIGWMTSAERAAVFRLDAGKLTLDGK